MVIKLFLQNPIQMICKTYYGNFEKIMHPIIL